MGFFDAGWLGEIRLGEEMSLAVVILSILCYLGLLVWLYIEGGKDERNA